MLHRFNQDQQLFESPPRSPSTARMNFGHFRTRSLRRSAQKRKSEKSPSNALYAYSSRFISVFAQSHTGCISGSNPVRVATRVEWQIVFYIR